MFLKRAWTLILATFVVYGLLVTPHKGEFWPFSIYQMFSSAGNPWSRVVVRSVDADDADDAFEWTQYDLAALPGTPYALQPAGVNVHDVAALVNQTSTWDASRRALLRQTLHPERDTGTSSLLVVQVRGTPTADTVHVVGRPVALVRPDTVRVAPGETDPSR